MPEIHHIAEDLHVHQLPTPGYSGFRMADSKYGGLQSMPVLQLDPTGPTRQNDPHRCSFLFASVAMLPCPRPPPMSTPQAAVAVTATPDMYNCHLTLVLVMPVAGFVAMCGTLLFTTLAMSLGEIF